MDAEYTILVVDDETDLLDLIAINLKREGFAVVCAACGMDALTAAQERAPDLIILDLMLPDLGGTEVCRRLRSSPQTADIPVIILSAKDDEIDRVVGFEIGADDYVTKPFSVRELLLRVRAVLRRRGRVAAVAENAGTQRFGLVTLDVDAHRVWIGGDEVLLTATEFRLLNLLIERAGRVQSRGALLQDVWGMPPDLNTRTVDTHVKRLREKLGAGAAHVETVRGVGYRFNLDASV